MSPEGDYSEEEIRDMDEKEFRKEFPSGWMELSRYETLVLMIDTLLESSPSREFTLTEIASQSGCSETSVETHIGSLVRLGVVNKLGNREPVRYSLNDKSPITQKLFELNLTVEKVKSGETQKSLSWDGNGSFKFVRSDVYTQENTEEVIKSHIKIGDASGEQRIAESATTRSRSNAIKPSKLAQGAD